MVASGGGHLRQLFELAPRLTASTDSLIWAVPKNMLSDSLLANETVVHIRYNGPRSVVGVLRNAIILRKTLRRVKIKAVITTGANHGLAAWPLAIVRRIPYIFIDTAARVVKPSLTGRIASALPGVSLYCQYPNRAHGRWQFAGSVFDKYGTEPQPIKQDLSELNVVVTVGAMEDIGFERLIHRCLEILPPDARVTWQVGPTQISDRLFTEEERFISAAQMQAHIEAADVIISHAGVGSAIAVLESGKAPVLVARSQAHGEHVDNHQAQISQFLSARGLAVVCTPETLTLDSLRMATALKITESNSVQPLAPASLIS